MILYPIRQVSPADVTGVIGKDVGAKCCAVKVDVDLSGGYGFVSQHLLYRPEICSPFEQVGSE